MRIILDAFALNFFGNRGFGQSCSRQCEALKSFESEAEVRLKWFTAPLVKHEQCY